MVKEPFGKVDHARHSTPGSVFSSTARFTRFGPHHTLLLTFALFAIAAGCAKQSTTTTPEKTKTMNCTLNICGDKKIQNPAEADIRQAVFALDTEKDAAFLVLGPTTMTYIQTSGDQKAGFDLEYQESDIRHHYKAKRKFTADEIVKALVSYSGGTDDWKKTAEWELIKL